MFFILNELKVCAFDIYIRNSNYKVLNIQVYDYYVTFGFCHLKIYLDSINNLLNVKICKQT